MNCSLCEKKVRTTNWFYVVLCDTCKVPLVISKEHKPEFSEQEKEDIKKLFGDKYRIRWQMRNITQHAHCHLK